MTRRLSQPHQHQKQQNFIHLETAEEKQRQHILSPPILQWAQSALCQVHGIKIHKESYCLFKFPSCIIILIHHIFNHIHHSISNRIHHSSSALIHTHLIKYIHAHTHTHTHIKKSSSHSNILFHLFKKIHIPYHTRRNKR